MRYRRTPSYEEPLSLQCMPLISTSMTLSLAENQSAHSVHPSLRGPHTVPWSCQQLGYFLFSLEVHLLLSLATKCPFLDSVPTMAPDSPRSAHTCHPHACFQHSTSSSSLLPPPHCLPPLHQNTSRGYKVSALSDAVWVMGSKIKWHKLFQMNHQAFWTSLTANFQTQILLVQGQEKRDINCIGCLLLGASLLLLYVC